MSVYFIRSAFFIRLHNSLQSVLNVDSALCPIPATVFEDANTLIPYSEITRWYKEVERLSGNPDYMLEFKHLIRMDNIGWFGEWLLSAPDNILAFRRFNYGMSHMQSGGSFYAMQTGNKNIIKWVHKSYSPEKRARFHESVYNVLLMLDFLKKASHDNFELQLIKISGSTDAMEKYKDAFGCDIEWNSPTTEVWFKTNDLLTKANDLDFLSADSSFYLSHNLSDKIDKLLNMPQANDEVKELYELANYTLHFGLPCAKRVADMLNISTQTLRRKLQQKVHFNFTDLSAYITTSAAVNLLIRGIPPKEVSKKLGFTHEGSFSRQFKKYRGVTPLRYYQAHNDKRLGSS
ncbi:helix-turn-helix domain-containing protein [Vibrio breoganii]|uniref:helix-turn-helix domain-containing protein n=1 Tax=Vibrio breoganii TaxID=553239 RepID=UPI0021C31E8A|nr:helix-turn-helix domain-containing protein [Vibrio breoganii]MDN3715742.1 helix-turn-helix domain-containing protein [Vibrio breoganii]